MWIAVINIAGLFEYGAVDNALHQVFLVELSEKAKKPDSPGPENGLRTASSMAQPAPLEPSTTTSQVDNKPEELPKRVVFKNALRLSNSTFALALRRHGDNKMLPHVNTMLAFITSLADTHYGRHLLDDAPWTDLVAFLNALMRIKTQPSFFTKQPSMRMDTYLAQTLFPTGDERPDELPLPEDYLTRGLVWTHGYFPENWFDRKRNSWSRKSIYVL